MADDAAAAPAPLLAQALTAQLEVSILPFLVTGSLDAARMAPVDTLWAAALRNHVAGPNGWDDGAILEFMGLAKYFPTPAEAAAAVSLVKATRRPSLAQRTAIAAELEDVATQFAHVERSLPLSVTLNKKCRAFVEEKLALVTRFHKGQQGR